MRREQLVELGDLFLMSLAFTLSCIQDIRRYMLSNNACKSAYLISVLLAVNNDPKKTSSVLMC